MEARNGKHLEQIPAAHYGEMKVLAELSWEFLICAVSNGIKQKPA